MRATTVYRSSRI